MGSREKPSPNYTEDGSGLPEVVGPVSPSFSTIPRLFANTSLRFNMEVLCKRYKRTSVDALSRVESKDIKLYLIFRLKSSSRMEKQGLRQSSAFSYYKTLQMVYQLDAKRQLGKPTNDMINAVSRRRLKEFRYYHPVAVVRFHPLHRARILSLCLSSPQTCVSICMLIGS